VERERRLEIAVVVYCDLVGYERLCVDGAGGVCGGVGETRQLSIFWQGAGIQFFLAGENVDIHTRQFGDGRGENTFYALPGYYLSENLRFNPGADYLMSADYSQNTLTTWQGEFYWNKAHINGASAGGSIFIFPIAALPMKKGVLDKWSA
jgi:hypothetical protein